ncbi:G-protein coupled receptor 26 [Merluccius polli]|uniref:G-protein coupled receptor 26 n=1 Tax=Merluccius polli TaxID=89951 RepID=A0AA47MPY9_MERPO|nr:G-protein coupled receptor 26 [Merluccius polli]
MHTADVAACVLVSCIIAVSLLSNVVVLICFLYDPEIRGQVPGIFTLNLTLCNLLLSASNMPLTVAGLVTRGHGPGPGGPPTAAAFCQLAGFLDTFLVTNAMLTMAALSVDRWVAVVFPLSYHSRVRRRDAAIALAYTWTHSLCFSAAAARLSWLGYHRLYASCTLCQDEAGDGARAKAGAAKAQFAAFTVALHALTFLLTLVVMCATYLKVLRVARSHCRRIDVITMQTLVLLVDIHPSVRQRCLDEQKRRRQRATKKISTFIGTFVLCFSPYVITRILELFYPGPISPHWAVLSKCLAYSKAATDPFVYSLLRHQYRKTCGLLANKILKRNLFNSSSAPWVENNSSRGRPHVQKTTAANEELPSITPSVQ